MFYVSYWISKWYPFRNQHTQKYYCQVSWNARLKRNTFRIVPKYFLLIFVASQYTVRFEHQIQIFEVLI